MFFVFLSVFFVSAERIRPLFFLLFLLLTFLQRFGRTRRRRVRAIVERIESTVVDHVLPLTPSKVQDVDKTIAPQDLVRQIRRPCLNCVSRCFDDALEDDDQFKAFLHKIPRRHIVERAVLIYSMHNGHGPDEEDGVLFTLEVGADRELCLMVGNDLALLGDLLADENGARVRLNEVGRTHVGHTEEKAKLTVAETNDSILTEHDGEGAFFRPRHLREKRADHTGLNHDADDALEAHDENGLGTSLSRLS